jgi:hypothetical protein
VDQDRLAAKSEALGAKTKTKNPIKWLKNTRLFRGGERAAADAAILSIEPDSDNQNAAQTKPAQGNRPDTPGFLPAAQKIVPQMPRDDNSTPALGSALLPPAKMPQARGHNNNEAPSGYYGPVPDDSTGFYAEVPSNVREQNNDRRAWRETAVIPRDPVARPGAQPGGLESNRFAQEGLRPMGINQRIPALNQQEIGRGAPRSNATPANAVRPGVNPPDASQANNSRPGINPSNPSQANNSRPGINPSNPSQANNSRPGINPSNPSQANNSRPGIRLPATPPGNAPRYGVNGSTPARNPVGQGAREGLITQSKDAHPTRPQQPVQSDGLTKPGGHTQHTGM